MDSVGDILAKSPKFARKGKLALNKIRAAYPLLKIAYAKGGLVLHPVRCAYCSRCEEAEGGLSS